MNQKNRRKLRILTRVLEIRMEALIKADAQQKKAHRRALSAEKALCKFLKK